MNYYRLILKNREPVETTDVNGITYTGKFIVFRVKSEQELSLDKIHSLYWSCMPNLVSLTDTIENYYVEKVSYEEGLYYKRYPLDFV